MHRRILVPFLLAAALAAPVSGFARGATLTPAGDLKIPKKEITGVASFYPYRAGNVLMEILAVRAPDATIRTALNTCQICYSSGRGFYTQQGDVLVCNNCGNRFKVSQVERIKGGCNPVPITGEWKTEEADFIVISKAFLEQAKPLFLNWKKR
ncbi:MAG: DUF2318 domain-containing protein [Acidobacteria bacterium]|jgi:hypothetical protein|nr:DUF2318 domain-containing protein [Spirochaetota bacterium]MBE3135155.1 DUF2318 domain-containing protein [Acidobacteriota bacterium]